MSDAKTSPKRGDQDDIRCAFVNLRPGAHDLGKRPDECWCYGCQFYICEACDAPGGVYDAHSAVAHNPTEMP